MLETKDSSSTFANDAETKKCNTCNREVLLASFRKTSQKPNEFYDSCNTCRSNKPDNLQNWGARTFYRLKLNRYDY
jgi:hypothetical protein